MKDCVERLGLALFLVFALSPCHARHKEKPNVIIFLTDDQGTLDVGCYGSGDLYTPSMDRLASEGIRFIQAYTYHFCCPTRAALLTGRAAHRSGINNWTQGNAHGDKGINMDLDEITIAEILKEHG